MTSLAEIEAKRRELQARRAARIEAARAEDELAEATRLLALEEAVEAAEADHGTLGRKIAVVHCLRADDSIAGSIIVKRPPTPTWRKFQDKATTTTADIAAVITACRVWPAADATTKLLDEYPAFNLRVMTTIQRLAGIKGEETSEKS